MKLRQGVIEFTDMCIGIYDVHEPDPKKKLIGSFPNHKITSVALGVWRSQVHYSCVNKTRFMSPTLNKEVTCRIKQSKTIDETKTNKLVSTILKG